MLALHPGPFPEKLAWILGYGEALDELEHRGWLLYCEGRYRFSEPQFRPYLTAGFGEGERCRLHARLAEAWEALGDPVAAAYHRFYGEKGEALKAAQLGSWRQALAAHPGPNVPLPRSRVRKGKKRALETEEIHLVSFRAKWRKLYWSWKSPSSSIYRGGVPRTSFGAWGQPPGFSLPA